MKRCSRCKKSKSEKDFYSNKDAINGLHSRCKKCMLECQKLYREQHYKKVLARERKSHQKNREKIKQQIRESRKRLKNEVFAAYGGYKCACCGETEPLFLSIDHINEDGAAHRRNTKRRTGNHFYVWLRKNNFPPGFQVLCFNCNRGKHFNKGICPHKVQILSRRMQICKEVKMKPDKNNFSIFVKEIPK